MTKAISTVPVDDALKQLEFWSTVDWPMTEAQASSLASNVGWTVEDDGRVYARRNPVEFQLVVGISNRDNQTVSFSFSLTDVVDDDADVSLKDELKDRFSDFVSAGRQTWGPPKLKRGTKPQASWDLGERGGIRIYQTDEIVAEFVTPDDLAIRKNMNDW